jgi:hypothetical protein
MTAGDLLKRQRGQAFNAEEALAARQLLVSSADDLSAKAKAANGGSDDALLAFRRALERHVGVQAQVSGMTAEAGRALRQFRISAGTSKADSVKAAIDAFGGRDNVEDLARLAATIDSPEGLTRFARDATKAKTSDMVLEAWINGLLSGPQTHVVNASSNTLVAVWVLPEHALAAGFGALRRGADRVHLREVVSRAFGTVQGMRDGLRAAAKAFRTEEPSDLLSKLETSRYQAIPSVTLRAGAAKKTLGGVPIPFTGEVTLGGKQIRLPGRLLQASDEFFKAVGYRSELNARAMRDGLAKGLRGTALAEHVQKVVQNPSDDLAAAALDNARYQTFTQPLGKIGQAISGVARSHPAVRLIVPFVRTPTNVAKFAVERSPFGVLMRDVRDNLRAGGATRDIQLARLTLGTGVGAVVAQLAGEGKVTGGGPSDRTALSALRNTGWQPYSIKIGDRYYSYARLEPLGTILGVSADLAGIAGEAPQDDAEKIAGRIVGSLSKNLASKTYLRGVSELVEAIDDPDRYGDRYVQNFLGTAIPTGVAQLARSTDPVLRDAQSLLDALKARIPGYSKTLPARRNLWGEPITLSGGLGPDLISPVYSSTDRHDRVSEEFARLGLRTGLPDRKVRDFKLSPGEYEQFVVDAGQPAKALLDVLVNDPGYNALPDDARRELFERTIRKTRDAARAKVLFGVVGRGQTSTTPAGRPSSAPAAPTARGSAPVMQKPSWAADEVPAAIVGGAKLEPGYEYDVKIDGKAATIRVAPDGRVFHVAGRGSTAPEARAPGPGTTPGPRTMAVPNPRGLVEPGNIDLGNRPRVQNANGSVSTVRSISIEEDGVEVLIPTVVGDRVVSDRDAIEHYRATGEHLGKFKDAATADAYAERLHEQQERTLQGRPQARNEVKSSLLNRAYRPAESQLAAARRTREALDREKGFSPRDVRQLDKLSDSSLAFMRFQRGEVERLRALGRVEHTLADARRGAQTRRARNEGPTV